MTLYEQTHCWQTNKKDSVRYLLLLHLIFAGGLVTLTASIVKCADRVWPRVDNIVCPQCTMGSMQIPPLGEIGRQYVKAPLAAAISLMHECEIRQMKSEIKIDHHTWDYVPYSFRTAVCGFFYVPHIIRNKCCETGPTVYRSYPRGRLQSLVICRCHYK